MAKTFERGIWQEAIRNFWANKVVVLTAIGLLMAITIYENYTHSKSGGGIWTSFVWLPVAIAAHATILNGQSGFDTMSGSRYKSVFGPFLWRSLGLSLIGLIPAMAIAILLVGARNETVFIYTLLAIYAGIETLILAKWGTMLPACVAEGDKAFKAAGARGSKTFSYAFKRFWGCNAILLVVGFGGLIFLYSAFSEFLDAQRGVAGRATIDALLQISLLALLAFNFVMLATILSRAYLIAEGQIKKAPELVSAF